MAADVPASRAAAAAPMLAVELEHAIGFSGGIPGGLHVLPARVAAEIPTGGGASVAAASGGPGNERFVAATGSCAVIHSVIDPHDQLFLRGHRGSIGVMALSPSGRLLATGEKGTSGSLAAIANRDATISATGTAPPVSAGGGSGGDGGDGSGSNSVSADLVGCESDVCVWDLVTGRVLHRIEEHDGGVSALAFSDDERLLFTGGSVVNTKWGGGALAAGQAAKGVDGEGIAFIFDLATGGIVAKLRADPFPLLTAVFGGFCKDIKGRDTSLYQLATGGSKGLAMWAIDPVTGATTSERVGGTGGAITSTTGQGASSGAVSSLASRDYLCLAFSPSADKTWLYAGTASGDLVIVHARTRAVSHSVFASGGGVVSVLPFLVASAPAAAAAATGGGHGYGRGYASAMDSVTGAGSNGAAERCVHVVTGGGDGVLNVYAHYTGVLEDGLALGPAVSGYAAAAAARPSLAQRTFHHLRSIRLDGAVWTLSALPLPVDVGAAAAAASAASGIAAPFILPPHAPLALLAGTSNGSVWRVLASDAADGSSGGGLGDTTSGSTKTLPGGGYGVRTEKVRTILGGIPTLSTTGTGLTATVFKQAHACAGEPWDTSTTYAVSLAASVGVVALPGPVRVTAVIGAVNDVAFAAGSSDRFATVSDDNTVRIWDNSDYSMVASSLVRSAGHAQCVVFGGGSLGSGGSYGLGSTTAGSTAASGGGDFTLSGWEDGHVRMYMSHPDGIAAMAAASGTGFGERTTLPDTRGGYGRDTTPTATSATTGPVSPTRNLGRRGPMGGEDRGFVWAISDAHSAKDGGVTALGLSHNQRFCVTGGGDGRVRVWDIRSREMVAGFAEHAGAVTSVAIYKDDAHLLSASRDKSFMCWDLRKERRISAHTQRAGGLHAVAITPDQSLVITSGGERKIQLWDLREPSAVSTIYPVHGLEGEATALAPSHGLNGRNDLIASGGTDAVVRFWDIRMGRMLAECVGHSGTVRKVAWSPDDKQLVSVGADGAIMVWNVYG